MKSLIIFLSALISASTFAGDECIAITKDRLCIQLEWTEGPYLNSFSTNVVKFKDMSASTAHKTVYRTPNQSIQFFGWMVMSGHEHGTRPLKTSLKSDGVFENTSIFYIGGMMGTWQFKLKLGEEQFVLHALDI